MKKRKNKSGERVVYQHIAKAQAKPSVYTSESVRKRFDFKGDDGRRHTYLNAGIPCNPRS